jgi:hypothetical protein
MESEPVRSRAQASAMRTLGEKRIQRQALDEIRAPASSRTCDRPIFRDLRRHLAIATNAGKPNTPDHALCISNTGAWTGHILSAGGDSCDTPAGTW